MTNRLACETSPYLLQHAENPVDWYAWGDDALSRAKEKDMPIFLSIGYSACHWCHVMAHESFEDETIAKLLNESFVSIKVDREERPDIDSVYQSACMAATGQGGWPLSAFLMPDQRPFYIGTYFPPLDTYGRPGFASMVRQLSQMWREQRSAVSDGAERFMGQFGKDNDVQGTYNDDIIGRASSSLMEIADATNGGFGGAPKFPGTSSLEFLLCCMGHGRCGAHALHTLKKMSSGGMFDHVGGGFHRYSTDARWLVPHFEKMTYDNALIPATYAKAYALTHDAQYRRTMERTLDFSLREMRSDDGGFYSALDADSEGEEGVYYVWSAKEIRDILGDDAEMFGIYYDVTDGGNWEGKTILCNNISLQAVSSRYGISEDDAQRTLDACLEKLRVVRESRTRPGLDDKHLTSWNAMMICALCSAAVLTRNERYAKAASMCTDFVRSVMTRRDDAAELLRTSRRGKTGSIPAYLEDYAWYANALADMFCAGGNPDYLEYADSLAVQILAKFYDSKGGFYMTESAHGELVHRPRSVYDLSVPSGSSVAMRALWRIGHLTGNKSYVSASLDAMAAREIQAVGNPFAFGSTLCAIYARIYGPLEVTLLDGGGDSGVRESAESRFIPEAIIARIDNTSNLARLQKYDFFAGKEFAENKQIAYVCKNSTCSAPLDTRDKVNGVLG